MPVKNTFEMGMKRDALLISLLQLTSVLQTGSRPALTIELFNSFDSFVLDEVSMSVGM